MKIYLDTEFNGFDWGLGELISLGLVDSNGSAIYIERPALKLYHPWVKENVVPLLRMQPEGGIELHSAPKQKPIVHKGATKQMTQRALVNWIDHRRGSPIICDWPSDHIHLLNCILGDNHQQTAPIPLNLQVVHHLHTIPSTPHHALSDAYALKVADEANDAARGAIKIPEHA